MQQDTRFIRLTVTEQNLRADYLCWIKEAGFNFIPIAAHLAFVCVVLEEGSHVRERAESLGYIV